MEDIFKVFECHELEYDLPASSQHKNTWVNVRSDKILICSNDNEDNRIHTVILTKDGISSLRKLLNRIEELGLENTKYETIGEL